MEIQKRLLGFDLFRGICALAIMLHHLSDGELGYGLHNIGTYGVYIFFILSGASLTIAYNNKIAQGMKYRTFLIRRYLRLAPLYWLLVLSKGAFGAKIGKTLLNITFLFGFFNPGINSRVSGGWSLGIEFVFYFFFPAFLLLSRNQYWRWVFLAICIIIQFLFVSHIITHDYDFNARWIEYTQFISFIAYFFIGSCIGRIFIESPLFQPNQSLCWVGFLILLLTTAVICLFSDYTALGTWLGFYLTICCAALVLLAGYLHIPDRLKFLAVSAGAMSYGVYLLHFRIYIWLKLWTSLKILGEGGFMMLVAIVTICVALLLERYLEKPIREWGYRRIISLQ